MPVSTGLFSRPRRKTAARRNARSTLAFRLLFECCPVLE
jgi:hypothetical protein